MPRRKSNPCRVEVRHPAPPPLHEIPPQVWNRSPYEPTYIQASWQMDSGLSMAVVRELSTIEHVEEPAPDSANFRDVRHQAFQHEIDTMEVIIRHNADGAYCEGGRIKHYCEGFYEDKRLTMILTRREGYVRRVDVDMNNYSAAVYWCYLVRKKAARMVYDVERCVVKLCVVMQSNSPEWVGVLGWVLGREKGGAYGKEWILDQVRRKGSDEDGGDTYLQRVREEKGLKVQLRPYQERAVAWMLERELGDSVRLFQDEEIEVGSFEGDASVSKLFVNVLEGVVCKEKRRRNTAESERGGLLCDEMGLGKTVELLQLVLCNQGESSAWEMTRDTNACSECEELMDRRWDDVETCLECGCVTHASCLEDRIEDVELYGYVCMGCMGRLQELMREVTPVEQLPKSKATLVVIPTSLLLQWYEEIQRHAGTAVKVVIFSGLKKSGYISRKALMDADIVLTTYEALRADVNAIRALRTPRTGLRNKRRYTCLPMPLMTMRWHRLALDESQMLGRSGVGQAVEMANGLSATYRWCITGTPMSRSVDSLSTMLNMLKIQGGHGTMDWAALFKGKVWADDHIVRNCLRKVMWRSEKRDVVEELKLPPQIREMVSTSFGPVERYHYQSLQRSVREAMEKQNRDGENTDKVSLDLLTMLRQACCHPQIGISGRRLMSNAARQVLGRTGYTTKGDDVVSKAARRAEEPLDMNEVLGALVTKAKVECQDALRLHVAASNGLAAVLWLQHSGGERGSVEGLANAVKIYRRTLGMVEENRDLVKLDNIQRMHILFNLKEALDEIAKIRARGHVPAELRSVGYTLRDGNLRKEVEELKSGYVAEAEATLVGASASYKEAFEKLGEEPLFVEEDEDEDEDEDNNDNDDLHSQDKRDHEARPLNTRPVERPWWDLALAAIYELEPKKQEAFINRTVKKLIDALPGGGVNIPTLANRLNSLMSFPLVVESELRELQKARCKLREGIIKLPGSTRPTPSDVAESGQCRECREFGSGRACVHCRSERLFTDVERRLYYINEDIAFESLANRAGPRTSRDPNAVLHGAFNARVKVVGRVGQNSGLRYQSEVESILKSMAVPLRAKGDEVLNKRISDWFSKFESMKKEHAEARTFFEAQRSLLASMDEVNMALMRLSVLEDGEDYNSLSEDQKRHRLPKASLPSLNVQFSNEKAVTETDFKMKRGSLVYLMSLQKSTQNGNDDESGVVHSAKGPRKCAVCLSDFDDSVLRVAVFVCGHVFCCDCTLLMIKKADVKARISSIMCPSCRVRCPVEEINFTFNQSTPKKAESGRAKVVEGMTESGLDEESEGDSDNAGDVSGLGKRKRDANKVGSSKTRKIEERASTFYDPGANVIGLIGAKSSAVVRTLRGIWNRDASSKIIIFSEWMEVLRLLSKALEMNEITHLIGEASAAKFAKSIKRFKMSNTHNVMLLQLRRAGAGLNLTEAEHVILMEPCMDISLERQATGRVHRIGQAKVTYVHRVIVRDTVEDIILALGDEFRGGGVTGANTVRLSEVIGQIRATHRSERNERNERNNGNERNNEEIDPAADAHAL